MDEEVDDGSVAAGTRADGSSVPSIDRRLIVRGAAVVIAALAALLGVGLSSDPVDPDAESLRGAPPPSSASTAGPTSPPDFTKIVSAENAGENDEVSDLGIGPSSASAIGSTTVASTTLPPTTVAPSPTTQVTAPPLDAEPAVVARPIPVEPPAPAPDAPPAPWADTVEVTAGGHVSTDVGCARDLSAEGLDRFFAERVGPIIGWDYQHVYPLGGDRALWLFQDAFVDHSNTAESLGGASFAHNVALVQAGRCFRLLHGGTPARPAPFEPGTGTQTLSTWFWPMGGEIHGDRLYVFWARMRKDAVDPRPPDGLGWHPDATFVGTYDASTLARLDFRRARAGGAAPIYGYAVQTQGDWTYLFGNTFEQNLAREGGWSNGPHSATEIFLARVPRGRVFDEPDYWTPRGWVPDGAAAVPILRRHWAEFPFQPRIIDGRWIASTAVDGYWGDRFELDVADAPWGPWTTVEQGALLPRGADPKMNTYHAHLMPWRDGLGRVVVSVSNNARNMLRDAWPEPRRYRPLVFAAPWPPPSPSTTTTTVRSTSSTTSTTAASSTTTTTTTATTSTTTTTTISREQTTTSASTSTSAVVTTSPTPASTSTTAPPSGDSSTSVASVPNAASAAAGR